jgi:hypothetical protein
MNHRERSRVARDKRRCCRWAVCSCRVLRSALLRGTDNKSWRALLSLVEEKTYKRLKSPLPLFRLGLSRRVQRPEQLREIREKTMTLALLPRGLSVVFNNWRIQIKASCQQGSTNDSRASSSHRTGFFFPPMNSEYDLDVRTILLRPSTMRQGVAALTILGLRPCSYSSKRSGLCAFRVEPTRNVGTS